MATATYLSIITLNVNGLNDPIKTRSIHMLPTRDALQIKVHSQTGSKGRQKDILCKWAHKNSGVAILISKKMAFKTKAVTRDKGHSNSILGYL